MRPSKTEPLMQALAIEIKARRLALEMSQEDLAVKCDLDRPYISLIEVARKQPTISVLLKFSDGLDYGLRGMMKKVINRYLLESR